MTRLSITLKRFSLLVVLAGGMSACTSPTGGIMVGDASRDRGLQDSRPIVYSEPSPGYSPVYGPAHGQGLGEVEVTPLPTVGFDDDERQLR